MSRTNDLGQPIGEPLDWSPASLPSREPMVGRFCRVESLDPERQAASLHAANCADSTGAMWTYLGYGPFDSETSYREWCRSMAEEEDPLFHAVLVEGEPVGVAAYLRIEPAVGVIEVGHIAYSPQLQRTTAATEAMYLMMSLVFDDLGYRRYEWKCDALNAPSRVAAERLGFRFEGVFRQATIYKGRNRDTAWYSVIDSDWPALKRRFATWLDVSNFSSEGDQLLSLGDIGLS